MATNKGSKQSKSSTKASKSAASSRRRQRIFRETEDPIIITGGSLRLEYMDDATDGFVPDTGSTPGGKIKLRHRKSDDNVAVDKVRLTRVVITKRNDVPLMEINLEKLGKNKDCKVKVFYETD